jgi:hypothetical protein
LNPLTVHAVNTCPFDANAKLIFARDLARQGMPAGHRREYSTISFSPAVSRCFAQWKANSVGSRWVPNTVRLLGNRSGRTTRFAPAGCLASFRKHGGSGQANCQ